MDTQPTKPKRRRKVERIEDWDDARYSVNAPRAAIDHRLTLIHFRLMSMLGRVNTSQGWCEMSQSAFAAALGYARGSVVRAVAELVEWRYVEKRGQHEAGSARCHYRLLVDDPEPLDLDPIESDEDGDGCETSEGTCHVVGDTSAVGTCHVPGDTGVTSHVTHVSRIKGTHLDQRSKITPPNPRAAGGQKGLDEDLKGKAAPLLAALKADGVAMGVVEHLLRPVLEARRFSAADRLGELRRLRDAAKALPGPALAKAAQNILAASDVVVKPERIAAAIAAAKKAGAMVVIRKGTAQWQRWAEHFAATEPKQAALMDRFPSWQVPSEWPPSSGKEVAA